MAGTGVSGAGVVFGSHAAWHFASVLWPVLCSTHVPTVSLAQWYRGAGVGLGVGGGVGRGTHASLHFFSERCAPRGAFAQVLVSSSH